MWFSIALACDSVALTALAKPGLSIEAAAVGIAAACPHPMGFRRALQKLDEPWLDVSLAFQATLWDRVCEGGIEGLPSGYDPPTRNERLRLFNSCQVEPAVLSEEEWLQASGPPMSAIMALYLFRRHGVPEPERRVLVRALLGVPEPGAAKPELGPLPKQVLAAKVGWPPNAKDPHCVVDVDVSTNGQSTDLIWVDCDRLWRPYVRLAVEGSIFEPARLDGLARMGTLRLTY